MQAISDIRHRFDFVLFFFYPPLQQVFPGQRYHSLGSLSREVPVLSCSGLTKRFLVPGWRMGWIVIHDRNGVLAREVGQGSGVRSPQEKGQESRTFILFFY